METRAFAPLYGPVGAGSGVSSLIPSVTVAVSGTAASAALPGTISTNAYCQLQIANTSSAWGYVNFSGGGTANIPAATIAASLPIAPSSIIVISVSSDVNAVSAISAGTGNIIFTRGEGL